MIYKMEKHGREIVEVSSIKLSENLNLREIFKDEIEVIDLIDFLF